MKAGLNRTENHYLASKLCDMRFTLLPLLVLVSALSYGQSYSIDDYELILEGTVDQSSPAQNTYYNALEEVTVSWSIVTLEGPSEWDFSFCFPNCYDIGVTEGDLNFTAGTEQYLNCHVYPNQTPGRVWHKWKLSPMERLWIR